MTIEISKAHAHSVSTLVWICVLAIAIHKAKQTDPLLRSLIGTGIGTIINYELMFLYNQLRFTVHRIYRVVYCFHKIYSESNQTVSF